MMRDTHFVKKVYPVFSASDLHPDLIGRCYAKLIVMQSQFRNPFKTKEFGKGVDRMYREMEATGLPEP